MNPHTWTDGETEWVYHNEYGAVCGYVKKLSDIRFYAEQGSEWCGTYVNLGHAKAAVEHAHKDPHRMPYPIE